MIHGWGDLLAMDPWSSKKQMVSCIRFDHMELVCRLNRPHSQVEVDGPKDVSTVSSEARHFDW